MKNKEDDFNEVNFGFNIDPNMVHKLAHSMHGISRGFGIKYWILMLVSKEKMTGAQMIDKIYEMSFGFWRPSPGSIYSILKYLSESGFVKVEQKDNKKYYSVTEKGKEYLDSSWFPWRSASSFMNKDEGTSIDETIETLDNLSEFISEKEKILSKENKKALKMIEDRLHSLLK
ncbi:PadR family transcriptional regulator [Candidatus Parvarchaeota archaeon]|nr:PadR family transcriptional regulator [Candidatus Parvarchaeota archaeon]